MVFKYCYVSLTIQLNISHLFTQLNDQTVLFLTIQFNINHLFALSLNVKSSIWPIDRTLSGATSPGQSGPGSNGNEGVLCIPQSSSITRTSPSDCLMSYPGHTWEGEGSYSSAEMQLTRLWTCRSEFTFTSHLCLWRKHKPITFFFFQ